MQTSPIHSTEQTHRSVQLDYEGLGDACPCHPDGQGSSSCDWGLYVPPSLASGDGDMCDFWIGRQEVLLCGAYFHFNKATSLSNVAGIDWPKRLAYFRASVENLMDLIFDTQDLEDLDNWVQDYTEDKLVDSCWDANEDRVAQLQYVRRLKLQAAELYKHIGDLYSYALVAEADGSRTISGNTSEYSDGVWSPFDDGTLSFTDLEGYRGLAAAFFLGTDIKVLDDLTQREGIPQTQSIQFACEKTNPLAADDEQRLFSNDECNERMLVPLAPCQVSSRNAHVEAALRLLRRYGVPVGVNGRYVDAEADLADFLVERVNQDRASSNLPPIADVDNLLSSFETSLEALSQGSRYLEQEAQIYLYNLRVVDDPSLGGDYAKYIDGHLGYKTDIQRTLVGGRVNGSRIGHEDIDVASGDVPLYRRFRAPIPGDEFNAVWHFNYFKHSYFKTLSFLRAVASFRINDPSAWWLQEPELQSYGAEINEPYDEIVQLVDDEIGAKEIMYLIHFLSESGQLPQNQYLTRTYDVYLLLPFQATNIEVISGKRNSYSATPGAMNDGLDGLRCRLYGEVGGQPCDLADYIVPHTSSSTCPAEYENCFTAQFVTRQKFLDTQNHQRYPLFLFIGGELVDSIYFEYGNTWASWEPSTWLPSIHWLRSQIDLPVRERIEKIIKRSDNQCSEPFYNSLGLRNDLVPPLENELISSGGEGSIEDSYQYYLLKAQDAAIYAGTKIDAANASEQAEVNYSNEVDELKAKSLNRLEQICGEGRETCTVVKGDYGLGDPPDGLWSVPAMNAADEEGTFSCDGYSQNYNLPNYLAMPEPPIVDSPGDFLHLGRWIRCHNEKWFTTFAEIFKIRDLPTIIANDPYLTGGSIYVYDGEYLAVLMEINSGLLDLLSNIHKLFFLQDTVGLEMAALQDEAYALANKKNAAEMKQAFALFRGILNVVKGFAQQSVFSIVSAGADLQSSYTMAVMEEDEAALNLDAAMKGSFLLALQRLQSIKQMYNTLRQNKLRIETGIQLLKKLELEQRQVTNDADRLEAAKLESLLGTECVDSDGQCLKSYRKLFNVKHLRALGALKRAQKMSFIAKRALEFKLGVDFTREKQDGIIVDAPSLWQDDVFRVFSDDPLYDGDVATTDYVKKLEDYLYGYPFDHPFADEEDLAVISVRDDLLGVGNERMCLVPVQNENYVLDSHDLEAWTVSPSDTFVEPNASMAPDPTYGISAEHFVPLGAPRFDVTSRENEFYGQSNEGFPGGQSNVHASIWVKVASGYSIVRVTARASYYQEGTYQRLFGRSVISPNVRVNAVDGWTLVSVAGVVDAPGSDQYVTIQLQVRSNGTGSGEVDLWGGQITATAQSLPYMPNPEFDVRQGCQFYQWNDPITNDPMSGYYPSPQLLAETMRQRFRIKCVDNAVALPSADLTICGPSENIEYFETDFSISLSGIMQGKILRQDQFAVGNYNYRLKELGVNLVGSNVKDCSLDPGAGSACYQNQFIPYDLTHGGHVEILDYERKTNQYTMSTGVIHYGKALAAERILTNPMSATDSVLLEPYKKSEFSGRPVQGSYILRIYNVPGLRWVNVEDIQIYMNYRYWSAFSNP